eukprot:TRINITY_DN4549_c1_g1_i2.p1 TRINITY_DN4549_c1_g1~~TRINITY_DN4549_c1_g1_i2.p1  ORF type:complete len:361 (+),score=69.02 TRINITY_DN4549_c1_g1_i2:87-1085(+)
MSTVHTHHPHPHSHPAHHHQHHPLIKRLKIQGYRVEVPVHRETGKRIGKILFANFSKNEALPQIVVDKAFAGSVEKGLEEVMQRGKTVEDAESRRERAEQLNTLKQKCYQLARKQVVHQFTGENYTEEEWEPFMKQLGNVKLNLDEEPRDQYIKIIEAVCRAEEYAIRKHVAADLTTETGDISAVDLFCRTHPSDLLIIRKGGTAYTVLLSMPCAKGLLDDEQIKIEEATLKPEEAHIKRFSTGLGTHPEPKKHQHHHHSHEKRIKKPEMTPLQKIAAYETHLNTLPVKALAELCHPQNIPTTGRKPELIERLMIAFETKKPLKKGEASDSD